MKELENFSFESFVDNIEAIKDTYVVFLSPFFDKKKIIFFKRTVYSFGVAEWKKDKVWEYLNGDINSEVFVEIAKHLK